MYIAFIDEFGHIGPYISRSDPKHNASPVFGMGGMLLPEDSVRHFATWFYQLKGNLLGSEIKKSGKHPATWEKKGSSLFTARAITKFPNVRGAANRLINKVRSCGGVIVYYGREKHLAPGKANAPGLNRTVLSQLIRNFDQYADGQNSNFLMILDEHSQHRDLLETAAKTMFGSEPARRLSEPPFQVESYLYQTVQAADWIAAILGRVWAYELRPKEYQDCRPAYKYFAARIDGTASNSSVKRL